MKTEKRGGSSEKAILIEAILDHEEKCHRNIYGMKYCQLCGKTQGYNGMYGAMAANSSNLFRCTSCKSARGKQMLDKWFKGSIQACIKVRQYVYCQLCGAKLFGTIYYVTRKLREYGYLCPACQRDVTERVSRGEVSYLVLSRQHKRLYLQSMDIKYLQIRNKYNREYEQKEKQRQLRLIKY